MIERDKEGIIAPVDLSQPISTSLLTTNAAYCLITLIVDLTLSLQIRKIWWNFPQPPGWKVFLFLMFTFTNCCNCTALSIFFTYSDSAIKQNPRLYQRGLTIFNPFCLRKFFWTEPVGLLMFGQFANWNKIKLITDIWVFFSLDEFVHVCQKANLIEPKIHGMLQTNW